MARQHFGRELWDRVAEFVANDDGLPTTELGSWTEDKLFIVGSYLAQTTTAMVGHPKFSGGLIYIDPFCGNGVCTRFCLTDQEPSDTVESWRV